MKRAISALGVIARLSERAIPYALLTAVIPLLVLAGFGLYSVFANGHLLLFIGILLGCTVLASAGLLLARRKLAQTVAPAVEHALEATPKVPDYWRERDRAIQRDTLPELAELLKQQPAWQALPGHALAVVRSVANRYHDNSRHAQLAFTAPELLAITEQVSRRYRKVLRAHVPGVDHIRLSTLVALNEQVERYGPLAMKLFNGYRAVRLFSPQGLLAEVLTQLRGEVFSGLSDELQNRLKMLLLLEVLRAAIDLYGGHSRSEDADLARGKVALADDKRQAPPLDPVRIGLVGQVGAGKSSLVNALTASLGAEVSALPATEGVTVYACSVDGAPDLRLVDLPGLDGSEAVQKLLFEQVRDCDLVLWVLKANQPARALDSAFRKHLLGWFEQAKNLDHQPPIIIGVLNQVDRLLPAGSWPEHWAPGDGSQASQVVEQALAYNREVMGLPELVPLALPPGRPPFNLDGLRGELQERYAQAVNVQLNRRRREAGDFSISKEMDRVRKAAVGVFELLK
ncbi:GTPase [Pseudomonas sp. NPDC007930]|uniref:GTPase family protein n=1 Tax=Pseudomonas sp. NPDC007930 TaxID=3364417 RepID=UPI0036E417AB